MKIKSAAELKKVVENKENISIVSTLFKAMAYEETVREVIEPKQQEVIDKYKFMTTPLEVDGVTRVASYQINSNNQMYRASEADFVIYINEMEKAYKELGFNDLKPGTCPLLVAESLTREARRTVIDSLSDSMGITFDDISHSLKHVKTYTDIILRLFASHVKELSL